MNRRFPPWLGQGLLVWLAAALAYRLARDSGVFYKSALDDALRVMVPAVALFAVCGFGLTRLLLPTGLKSEEALWVLPIGACAAALAFTILGYAGVPFLPSLIVVPLAGIALGVWALRRPGAATGAPAHAPPASPAAPGWRVRLGWPFYVAALLAFVSLIPMFRAGFATVVGQGSDAHLAAGTADFLQHSYPLNVDASRPVDQIPLVWRSKAPIYYVLGATAKLGGVETFRALSATAAVLFALSLLGIFLLARRVFASGLLGAVVAMGVVGLDRMVLHTVMHPYFNQTWGWMTLPFSIVLAWWAVHERTRGGLALLVMFMAVGAFAYPLMLPIPLLAFVVWERGDRRDRRSRGETPRDLSPRRLKVLWHGPRSLLWMVPLALLLYYPVGGALEKAGGALAVVLPNSTLVNWGGDLNGYFPENQFISLPWHGSWPIFALALVGLFAYALRDRPRDLGRGLWAVLAFGALVGAYMRARNHGWYFHFKVLAFIAPLLVAGAAVGASKLARLRIPVLGLLVVLAFNSGLDETRGTFEETSSTVQQLMHWSNELPAKTSIRLDISPDRQLWAAYMLYEHPLCSQVPILGTSYPHVPQARKADYVIVETGQRRPFDAFGLPVLMNTEYTLYRLSAGTPGPSGCSQRMVQTVKKI